MITVKDKIEQFKRDCRSMEYWTKMYIDCNERLEDIAVKLMGISAVRTDGVILENAGDPYKNGKIYWFYEEEKVVEERNQYANNMARVNSMISKIPNPNDQQMIRDLYIEKKNHEVVAEKYHYNDRSAMHKHVNKVLSKILK